MDAASIKSPPHAPKRFNGSIKVFKFLLLYWLDIQDTSYQFFMFLDKVSKLNKRLVSAYLFADFTNPVNDGRFFVKFLTVYL